MTTLTRVETRIKNAPETISVNVVLTRVLQHHVYFCTRLTRFLALLVLRPVIRLKRVHELLGNHLLSRDGRCFLSCVRRVQYVVLTEALTVGLGSEYSILAECKF